MFLSRPNVYLLTHQLYNLELDTKKFRITEIEILAYGLRAIRMEKEKQMTFGLPPTSTEIGNWKSLLLSREKPLIRIVFKYFKDTKVVVSIILVQITYLVPRV